jgi:hypothetical protein
MRQGHTPNTIRKDTHNAQSWLSEQIEQVAKSRVGDGGER